MSLAALLFPTIIHCLTLMGLKKIAIFTLLAIGACTIAAQRTTIASERIKTVRLVVDGNASRPPILIKGSNSTIEVSFDDLTHEYERYVYRIEHCNFNFQPSEELFESDYLISAGNEEVIDDYEPSLNTTVLYNHYTFTIPNSNMQPLLSGNYRLQILKEGDNGELSPVVTTFFYIVEPLVSISTQMTTNTEIDWDGSHQQLEMRVQTQQLPQGNIADEIKTIILQNRRWDNAIRSPKPTSVMGTELLWQHSRDLIFKAGNEYRKFEMQSTHVAGMRLDYLRWYPPFYHAAIMPDKPRRNYLYDEDLSGRYIVSTVEGTDNDTESDYILTHFTLYSEQIPGYDVYLNGHWTYDQFVPDYRLDYNFEEGAYEGTVLIKQGYYNYQYLAVPHGQNYGGETGPFEGNYFQAENEYIVLVYYRRPGERYDRLVGTSLFYFRP